MSDLPLPSVEEINELVGPTPTVHVDGTWSVPKVLEALGEKQVSEGEPGPTTPIPFFHALERLKSTKREGWRRFNIMQGESIADHMYRMAMITFFIPSTLKVDVQRCARMALVHDLAELYVGDITPVDGVSKPEKSRRELETISYLTGPLLARAPAAANAAPEIRELWQEYEEGRTLESRVVHDIDKLELLLQMVEYEKRTQCRVSLAEFDWVRGDMRVPELQAWGDQVLEERRQLWADLPEPGQAKAEDPAVQSPKQE